MVDKPTPHPTSPLLTCSCCVAFVKADDTWDHRGPEIPLIYDLFEVSAFHQVHCLVGLKYLVSWQEILVH